MKPEGKISREMVDLGTSELAGQGNLSESLKEGLKLFKQKKWDQALYFFDEENPLNHPLNAYYMALCHMNLSHWDETLELLDAVMTSDDNLLRIIHCQILRGYALIKKESYREAEAWLERIRKDGTDSVQVQSLLGYCLFMQGRRVEGLRHLNQALKMDPDNPNTLNSLGYVLAEEGKHMTKALGLIRKAHFAQPENPAYLDSLGWVLFKMNQPQQALDYVEKAFKKNPHPTIRSHLEEIRRSLGKSGLLR